MCTYCTHINLYNIYGLPLMLEPQKFLALINPPLSYFLKMFDRRLNFLNLSYVSINLLNHGGTVLRNS